MTSAAFCGARGIANGGWRCRWRDDSELAFYKNVLSEISPRRRPMSLGTILLIILILILIGALPTWPYSTGWGYYPSGGLGLVVIFSSFLSSLAGSSPAGPVYGSFEEFRRVHLVERFDQFRKAARQRSGPTSTVDRPFPFAKNQAAKAVPFRLICQSFPVGNSLTEDASIGAIHRTPRSEAESG
jgi:Protein of unknown function (DUF3309)